jgi:hypothetical protein
MVVGLETMRVDVRKVGADESVARAGSRPPAVVPGGDVVDLAGEPADAPGPGDGEAGDSRDRSAEPGSPRTQDS